MGLKSNDPTLSASQREAVREGLLAQARAYAEIVVA